MRTSSKLWVTLVVAGVVGFSIAAIILPRSFALTALTDMTEALLLLSGAVSFVPLALGSKGRVRLFWSLLVLGLVLWFAYQLLWMWYEVLLRRDVPDLFAGDLILFLHIVPLMAALALRPHIRRDESTARLGHLDFGLLLVWWFYLYFLIVLPWQYAVSNLDAYNRNLNALYLAEEVALLLVLAASWAGSKGPWKALYASLFGMSLIYSASSALANWAIAHNLYYSGIVYDIPLAVAMSSLTWIGLRTQANQLQPDLHETFPVYGVWVARCSMIAVFSLPLFAAWAIAGSTLPSAIRIFRLVTTLIAAFVMGVMVFFRQYLMDRELVQLLQYSREGVDNLKRLQAQVLQSEKLASIGQLVGGAAHELNNPITAMLGYSDLLMSTPLTPSQQNLATKIGQYVRRTRSLVASLVSFARQAPAPKAPLDLNTLLRTAVKLAEPQWESQGVQVQTYLDPQLARVLGDSNQMLQVCLQVLGVGIDLAGTGKCLTVRTRQVGDRSLLMIGALPVASSADKDSLPDKAPQEGVGLSACRGILQEHGGSVSLVNGEGQEKLIRVELPSITTSPSKTKESSVPGLWQSRPFA